MNKLLKATLLPMTLLASAAGAQTISAQSIVVNPIQPDLNVQVSVDKDATGERVPTYRLGESIRIDVKTNRDAYVYLFNLEPDGEVTQILPNRLDGRTAMVRGGTTVSFPPSNANYKFDLESKTGLNKVFALASLTELDTRDLAQFESSQSQFATSSQRGQDQFAQALSIVVNPIPQNNWVTDTALFDVASRTPIRTGSLFVGTNVSNAQIIMNGRNYGYANRTITGIAPGTYPIKVRVPGYQDFATTIRIRANQTTNLNVDFNRNPVRPAPVTPVVSTYDLSVRSSLEGGRVFINGEEAGKIRRGELSVQVERGQYEIVIVAPGKSAEIGKINVTRDGYVNLSSQSSGTTINLLDLLFR